MIRSFLTITLRVLWRNKVTSLVNIFSLSVGITAFLFIMLYVQNETGYDEFNKNYKNIYRLDGDDFARLPAAIGPHVKDRIPEVRTMARLVTIDEEIDIMYKPDLNPENIKHMQAKVLWADSTTFDVFTFPFIQGDPTSALSKPFTCVITESVAKAFFANTDPVRKTVELFGHQFEVTGVIKDVKKSHIDVKVLVSHNSIPKVFLGRDINNTGRSSWLWSATYLLMEDQIDVASAEKKINNILAEINDGKLFDTKFQQFRLLPLKDIYFEGPRQNLDYGYHGSFKLVSILFIIGIFMLAIAATNYVNLTTARSTIRTKEIAVKRVVGSSIFQVRLQLILESIIISVAALVIALTFTQIFIGPFNHVTGVNIRLAELNRPEVWASIFLGAMALGIAAGIYPAIYLTAVKPVKQVTNNSDDSILSRSILMTFQFTLSIILMVCALVIVRQLDYMRNADVGFDKQQIIQLDTPFDIPEEFSLRETFKNHLLQFADIRGVTYSAGSQAGSIRVHPIEVEGKKYTLEFFLVDHDFFDVMNIEVLEGKSFPRKTLVDLPTLMPDKFSILLNECAVRGLGLKSPVGKNIYWDDQGIRRSYEIIGVVKDFHFRSLHHKIGPLMIVQTPPMLTASIKISSSRITGALKTIKREWKKVYGDRLFTFKYLDEKFNHQYETDEQLATVIFWFTGLALVIACLGLFALSSSMITRRTKEIGIRKSMGASVRSIYVMLSWDFLKWVVAAVIIGCPIAGYLMKLWLNKFAYHITLENNIFIIAASLAFGTALLTVTLHALRAANSNPIKALRYE